MNIEEKVKSFVASWIESEKKKGNLNPDSNKFPKNSLMYATWNSYENVKTNTKLRNNKNPEVARERSRIWRKENPERKKEQDRNYRKANNETLKKYQKNYRNNPEKREHLLKQKKEYHQKLLNTNSPLLEKWRVELKKNYDELRWDVLLHYSPIGSTEPRCCCPNCPEIMPFFMSIDHINGGGSEHRRRVGSGRTFHKWLKDRNFPEGYRTMCHNCNHAREYMEDKKCPHELIDSNTNPFIKSSEIITIN